MTQSPITLRSVVLGLVLGAMCCWWMLRSRTTPPTPREATTRAASATDVRPPSKARSHDAAPESASGDHATPEPEAAPTVAKSSIHIDLRVESAEDETPIVGARVADSDSQLAKTGADGVASFDLETSGTRPNDVRVEADGFVPKDIAVGETSRADPRMVTTLQRGFYVEGVVRGADGAGVAGATVVARDGGYDVTPRPEITRATTGDDGRFRIGGLPLRSAIEYEIAATSHVGARRFRGPNDKSPLDVTLDPAGRLHVLVRTPDGKPAAQSWVGALRAGEYGVAESGITDDDGGLTLDGLAFGVWTCSAGHDDSMNSEYSPAVRLDAAHAEASCELKLRMAARVEIDLGFATEHVPSVARLKTAGGDNASCATPGVATFVVRSSRPWTVDAFVPGFARESVETQFAPGETKRLTVRFREGASISGIAVDDAGAPVAEAVVSVEIGDGWTQQAVSAADGTFRVVGLATEPHAVKATANLHVDFEKKDVTTPSEGLRAVLPRFGEAAVRVRLPDGARPPSSGRIEIGGSEWSDKDAWDGREIVRALPPGERTIRVDADGYAAVEREIVVHPGLRTDAGEIVLEPGFTVTGRVLDADGNPVPGQLVHVGAREARTDRDGRFVAEHVASGETTIYAFDSDSIESTATCVVGKATPPVTLRFGRVVALRVKLLNVSQFDPVYARLYDVAGKPAAATVETPDTDCVTIRFRPGKWRVSIRKQEDDSELASRDVDLTSGRETTVEIALPK